MSLKMSVEERIRFLSDVHVGVISIEVGGRAPLTVPIWYDFDPKVGVWVLTGADSRKGVALAKAGRYSLSAQQEDMPYRYVSVSGPVIEVRPADLEKDSRPMARRYLGREMGDAYVEGGEDGQSNVYVMQPQQWLTVDYGKMTAGGNG
jgi:nitroimidazol reductase NimA-like FMN-containing flavoprotein (pyridoxamine 5'-phosphate oxidase superfamily)